MNPKIPAEGDFSDFQPSDSSLANHPKGCKTKETDKGVALFAVKGKKSGGSALTNIDADNIAVRITKDLNGKAKVTVYRTFNDLPDSVKAFAARNGLDASNFRGSIDRNNVAHVVQDIHQSAEEFEGTILHELCPYEANQKNLQRRFLANTRIRMAISRLASTINASAKPSIIPLVGGV